MRGSISPKVVAAVGAVLFFVTFSFGQAGSLDSTFNGTGKRVFDPGGNGALQRDGAIQSDGKVLMLNDNPASGMLMARVNPDGTPDGSFGVGGIVTSDWHYSQTLPSGYAYGMALQVVNGEERIVVAGSWTVPQGKRSSVNMLRVDRYLPNGQLDTSFGPDHTGKVIVNKPYALAVAIQPDNKIVTVGDLEGVVRFNADGSVDNAFGNRGDGTTGAGQAGWAITVRPSDGRILIAGSYGASYASMCVSALNPNGSVAEDFGTGGRALIDFYGRGSFGRAFDIALDPFGNILAAGNAQPKGGISYYAAARLLPNGQPDTSFNGTGKVTYSFFGLGNNGRSVTAQADGRVVLGGNTTVSSNVYDLGLVRFNYNGTVDTTFGAGGKVTTDVNGGSEQSDTIRIWNDPGCGGCEKIVLLGGGAKGAVFARYLTQ